MSVADEMCACGDEDCWFVGGGYPWCIRCRDHHRHPETCPGVTETGAHAEYRYGE